MADGLTFGQRFLRLMAGQPRSGVTLNAPPVPGVMPSTESPDPALFPFPFLTWQHPVYKANLELWLRNERRLLGGDLILDELVPFDWEVASETDPAGAYMRRQAQAVYPNFPDKFATLVAGHLLRSAPRPDQGLDFGTLGKVGESRTEGTRAEQVYYSCDMPGDLGIPWDAWWEQRLKLAMATGHRWILVNGPPARPANKLQERYGGRPYLMEFSPIHAPGWYYNRFGQLEFIIFRVDDLDPYIGDQGTLFTQKQLGVQMGYLLFVRAGCSRLGAQFNTSTGGWYYFDSWQNPIDAGNLADTDGEIPVFPHFYETSKGTKDKPMISRTGTSELGNCAIAMMNLSSAADFDAWDAGRGIEWLLGVDLEAWNLATEKIAQGSRRIPLTPHAETDQIPAVQDAGIGAVAADVFAKREESLWNRAQWLGITEADTGNRGTAAGANADFSATQMPRIVRVAMNLQAAQTLAIYFLEKRYGNQKPTGQAVWPTRYNLVELTDRINSFFATERLSGLRCSPLDVEALLQLAIEKGLVSNDADMEKYRKAATEFADLRDSMLATDATTALGQPPQDPNKAAMKQSSRIAANKDTGGAGGPSPGKPAPAT